MLRPLQRELAFISNSLRLMASDVQVASINKKFNESCTRLLAIYITDFCKLLPSVSDAHYLAVKQYIQLATALHFKFHFRRYILRNRRKQIQDSQVSAVAVDIINFTYSSIFFKTTNKTSEFIIRNHILFHLVNFV